MILRVVKIKVKCPMCGNFETEYKITTNEHGYLEISEGYCPHCLSLLVQEIIKDEKHTS